MESLGRLSDDMPPVLFSGILPVEEAAEEAPGKGKRLRAQQRALLALQREVEAKKKEFEQVSQQHHFLQQRLKVIRNANVAPVPLKTGNDSCHGNS